MAIDTELVDVKVGSKTFGPLMRINADSLAIQLALQGNRDIEIIKKETNA